MRVEFLEFAVHVTESLGLLGSAGGVVFGIEVDDEIFSLEIFQSDNVAIRIGQAERRRGFAFMNCHNILLELNCCPIYISLQTRGKRLFSLNY